MRVAVVVRSLAFGGMEKVAITLSESFHEEGHESHLVYFTQTPNKLPAPKEVHLHSFELRKSMKISLFGIGFLWKIISQILNIMIRNSYFVWSGLYTSILFKQKIEKIEKEFGQFDLLIFRGQGTFEMMWAVKDSRFVFVNESLLFKNKFGFLQKIYAKILFKDRNVVSISSGVYNSFEEVEKNSHFHAKKHILITNPIRISSILSLANHPIDLPTNPYIMSAGRFHAIKNFPLLIEAYAYARKNLGLTLDLVLIGEGKERKIIEEYIKKFSLESYIHLPGYIENPYPWMKHASLFVLTSKIEGLGMVLLESMVCSTDIVATNSPGGIKDIMIDDLASHICQSDPIILAKKIVEVLQYPSKDFSTYLQPYTSEKITKDFIDNFMP